jgi:RNA polymerase sigma-70 factor (ECF subfamily)
MQFISKLSPPLRDTFRLRGLDGLTTAEVAHLLGLPEGTVKTHVARARVKLGRLMRPALAARAPFMGAK